MVIETDDHWRPVTGIAAEVFAGQSTAGPIHFVFVYRLKADRGPIGVELTIGELEALAQAAATGILVVPEGKARALAEDTSPPPPPAKATPRDRALWAALHCNAASGVIWSRLRRTGGDDRAILAGVQTLWPTRLERHDAAGHWFAIGGSRPEFVFRAPRGIPSRMTMRPLVKRARHLLGIAPVRPIGRRQTDGGES
jgi:hypothetical protein